MRENEKLCTSCGEVKAAADFGVQRRSRDGLQAWCKRCRITSNVHRESERIRVDPEYRERRASRMRTANRPAEVIAAIREKQAEERRTVGSPAWARMQLARAVYRGKVVKPASCERCGVSPERHLLHGHHWHDDYAGRPLDVQWLCTLCHADAHKGAAA